MMTDKERIEKIISEKKLSNVEFCNETAMSPSSLSHILSERTKPTLATLRNIIEAFPDLNPMWVLLGQGEMYGGSGQSSGSGVNQQSQEQSQKGIDDVFASLRNGLSPAKNNSPAVKSESAGGNQAMSETSPVQNVEEVVALTLARLQKPRRKVTEVRIFFDDGTYETFNKSL